MGLPDLSSGNLLGRFPQIVMALSQSPAVSFILNSAYHIVYCNPAWDDFARSNQAPQLTGEKTLGLNIFQVIPNVLKNFYQDAYARAMSQGIWEFSYECSTPELFRKYRMRVHGLGTPTCYMVTNALIHEGPHRRQVKAASKKYVQPTGLINMCSHCRCSQRVDHPERWDFVPDYLRLKGPALLTLSHGFCPICYAYHYGA